MDSWAGAKPAGARGVERRGRVLHEGAEATGASERAGRVVETLHRAVATRAHEIARRVAAALERAFSALARRRTIPGARADPTHAGRTARQTARALLTTARRRAAAAAHAASSGNTRAATARGSAGAA